MKNNFFQKRELIVLKNFKFEVSFEFLLFLIDLFCRDE